LGTQKGLEMTELYGSALSRHSFHICDEKLFWNALAPVRNSTLLIVLLTSMAQALYYVIEHPNAMCLSAYEVSNTTNLDFHDPSLWIYPVDQYYAGSFLYRFFKYADRVPDATNDGISFFSSNETFTIDFTEDVSTKGVLFGGSSNAQSLIFDLGGHSWSIGDRLTLGGYANDVRGNATLYTTESVVRDGTINVGGSITPQFGDKLLIESSASVSADIIYGSGNVLTEQGSEVARDSITIEGTLSVGMLEPGGGGITINVRPGGVLTSQSGDLTHTISYSEYAVNVEGQWTNSGVVGINNWGVVRVQGGTFSSGQVNVLNGGECTVSSGGKLSAGVLVAAGGGTVELSNGIVEAGRIVLPNAATVDGHGVTVSDQVDNNPGAWSIRTGKGAVNLAGKEFRVPSGHEAHVHSNAPPTVGTVIMEGGDLYGSGGPLAASTGYDLTFHDSLQGNGKIFSHSQFPSGSRIGPNSDIAPFGTLDFTSARDVSLQDGSIFRVCIGGTGSAGVHWNEVEARYVTLNGVIEVELCEGFIPEDGDTFQFIDAADIAVGPTASVNLDNAMLGSGYSWNVDLDAGTLSVSGPEIQVEQPLSSDLADDGPAVDFGEKVTGGQSSLEFTVRNVGSANLTGLTITIDGPDADQFRVSSDPTAPVTPSSTTTFTVEFSPNRAGAKTAALHIANNDADEGFFDIHLTGNGIAPMTVFNTVATSAGLSGNDAMYDSVPFNDGIKNLLKYAFNLNLSGPDTRQMMEGGTAGLPSTGAHEDAGQHYWRVEFVRRKDSGLIYSPQKSTNLAPESWSPLTSTPTITDIDANWERVVYDEPYDPTITPECFTVIEVTMP
jgi:hypothetical protein